MPPTPSQDLLPPPPCSFQQVPSLCHCKASLASRGFGQTLHALNCSTHPVPSPRLCPSNHPRLATHLTASMTLLAIFRYHTPSFLVSNCPAPFQAPLLTPSLTSLSPLSLPQYPQDPPLPLNSSVSPQQQRFSHRAILSDPTSCPHPYPASATL